MLRRDPRDDRRGGLAISYSRVPQKVDANQGEIVKALRKAGCSVVSLAAIGDGTPDLLVGRAGHTFLLEVKNPEYRCKGDPGKDLTDLECAFLAAWRGPPVHIVTTAEEALCVVCPCEADVAAGIAAAPDQARGQLEEDGALRAEGV